MAVKQLTGSMQASTVLAGERNPRRARLRGRTSAPRRPPACRQCLALVAEPALAVSFVDLRPLVVLAPGRVIDPLPRARDVALERAPQQAAIRLLQEYGLAERLPSSSMAGYGTILRATAGTSIGERSWAIVQNTRRRKMERRHLLR